METSDNKRNSKGQFAKGHPGAKPKGAANKENHKFFQRIERIVGLLEVNLQENINKMSEKDQVRLWIELQKIMLTKFPKITDPPTEALAENEKINVIFMRGEGEKE